MIGQKFGKLEVLADFIEGGRRRLTCACACGKVFTTRHNHAVSGRTKSCGCQRLETIRTHGDYGSQLYWIWKGMKGRCHCSANKDYRNYGARGIKVCHEWIDDFASFKEWAIRCGYSGGLTIDRIDGAGDYSPENCQFVTRSINSGKTRRNVKLTAFGETKNLMEWSLDPRCEVTSDLLRKRVRELGWKPERAMTVAGEFTCQ